MVTLTTSGVTITVETFYHSELSDPLGQEFMFAYRITIENNTGTYIKLLRRHWYIFDSCGIKREVEGEGVVGKMPVIPPGGNFSYISGCNLRSDIGMMHGYYTMQRQHDGSEFHVHIPQFLLIAPFKNS